VPTFFASIHLVSTAKVSDFWGLNCAKTRPNFYDAETLLLCSFSDLRHAHLLRSRLDLDQIETTTEPGASRKALPERMNQHRPGNAKRWFAGACALCALPRIQVDRAFQKLVDRFLNS
jgi:hypothetical protein